MALNKIKLRIETIKIYWIVKLNSNTLIGVWIELKKRDANWWKRYGKSAHEYDVQKYFKNTQIQKKPFHAFLLGIFS